MKVTLYKLFPPYGDMQLIPWYSFVDGRPWLLPVAWIYRLFYCLRHKSGHSMALLEEPYTCRREGIKERQAMLSHEVKHSIKPPPAAGSGLREGVMLR